MKSATSTPRFRPSSCVFLIRARCIGWATRSRGGSMSAWFPPPIGCWKRTWRGPGRKVFAEEALGILKRHGWPFNVRELQQVVERAVCLVDHEVVTPGDLPDYILREVRASPTSVPPSDHQGPPVPLRSVVDEAARRHILRALDYTKGNRRRAIELLQISPETFYRRLEELGLHKKSTENS